MARGALAICRTGSELSCLRGRASEKRSRQVSGRTTEKKTRKKKKKKTNGFVAKGERSAKKGTKPVAPSPLTERREFRGFLPGVTYKNRLLRLRE